jgi:hypothetical protein
VTKNPFAPFILTAFRICSKARTEFAAQQFGLTNDKPVPTAYLP